MSGSSASASREREYWTGNLVTFRTQAALNSADWIALTVRDAMNPITSQYVGSIFRNGDISVGSLNGGLPTWAIEHLPTGLNPVQEDVVLQIDANGDDISFWAWAPDEEIPSEPLFTYEDGRIDGGIVTVNFGSSSNQDTSGILRFLQVDTGSISDIRPVLQAGDANQDLSFDQLDLVQVQIAAKYFTGQTATWGDGDWNGAPGGGPGTPPPGNGLFDQFDVIAALGAGTYLTGPYTSVQPRGKLSDGQTSVVYDATTGEIAVDSPAGRELTSINIDSASGVFTGDAAQNLGGSFDNDADNNVFKATFGSTFGSLSFGNVAQAGLSQEFFLGDLTVIGSLAGGGDLGDVDLIYVPEPASALLLTVGLVIGLLHFRRSNR
jgi:hypothetical protein